jgi:DNA-binding transcriptional regulator LsrR (DeoR family)
LRLLRQARAQGIVRIEVRPPSPAGELAEGLGLRRAAVVPAQGLDRRGAPAPAEATVLASIRP